MALTLRVVLLDRLRAGLGCVDHAAAGFMEEFAAYRNQLVAAGQRTGRTLAIAWPHWLDGGMNVDDTSKVLLEKRTGLRSMATADGMAALARGLALAHSHVMVMHGDAADMRRALATQRSRAANAGATAAAAAPVAVSAPGANPGAAAVSATSARPGAAKPAAAGELVGKTREFLRNEFAAVLKIPPQRVETRAALENYGIDSILAMNLTNRLEATFGTLAKTLFFEYRTIDELADHFVSAHADTLHRLFATATSAAPAQAARPAAPASPALTALRGRRGRQRFLPAPAPASVAAPSRKRADRHRRPERPLSGLARPRGVLAQPARRPGLHRRGAEGALGLAAVLQRGPQEGRRPTSASGAVSSRASTSSTRASSTPRRATRARSTFRRSACFCSTHGWRWKMPATRAPACRSRTRRAWPARSASTPA
jgi:acyl carrier protein